MKKFAFSADHETISENLGISEERHDLFFEKAKEVSMRAILFDKSIADKSQAIEIFLNEVQPETEIEFFWAGVVFMDTFTQTEKVAKEVGKVLNRS